MGEGCSLEHLAREGCCFITLPARSHTLCQSAPTPAVLRGALPHQPWDGCESCRLTLRAWQVGADSSLAPLVTSPGAWSTLLVSGGLCPYLQSKDMNPQRAGASGLSPVSHAKGPLSHCCFSRARHPVCVGPSGHPPCPHGALTWEGRPWKSTETQIRLPNARRTVGKETGGGHGRCRARAGCLVREVP